MLNNYNYSSTLIDIESAWLDDMMDLVVRRDNYVQMISVNHISIYTYVMN